MGEELSTRDAEFESGNASMVTTIGPLDVAHPIG